MLKPCGWTPEEAAHRKARTLFGTREAGSESLSKAVLSGLPACGVDHVTEALSEVSPARTTAIGTCKRWRTPTAPRSRERLRSC
jgi:hypothetical protein